jgi:predicted DNA-binding WGR domain protein
MAQHDRAAPFKRIPGLEPALLLAGKTKWKPVLPPDIVVKMSVGHYMYHSPIQLDVFPTDVQMRRIDPARNMRRFYRLSVQRDLFGRASLVREWGRIGFRGQMMVETHPDEGNAITALMKLAAVKKRRGYEALHSSD